MADSTTPDATPDATRDHLAQILLDHVDVARQVDGEPMLTCTCGEFAEEWKPAHSSGFLAHRADAVLAALRDDAIAALNREVARRIGVARELTAIEAERDELRKLTASCSCASGPNFEGPSADCPVHGAVRAFNQASAEIARLTTERDDLRTAARMYAATVDEIGRQMDSLRAERDALLPVVEKVRSRCRSWIAATERGNGAGEYGTAGKLILADLDGTAGDQP